MTRTDRLILALLSVTILGWIVVIAYGLLWWDMAGRVQGIGGRVDEIERRETRYVVRKVGRIK